MLWGVKFGRTGMTKRRVSEWEEKMLIYPGSRVTGDRFIKKKNEKDYRTAR